MKLLLGTSYLLPIIGVSIKDFPRDTMIKLIKRGYQISISDITIFELSAIGAKHAVLGRLDAERVCRGIRAILHDERITRIPIHDSSILLTALELRRMLSDFIDCLILSSAMARSEILITEDKDIQDLSREEEFQEFLKKKKSEFKIQPLHAIS
ncbi:MAG: PIN domain-containing protein [Candidatus Bathyarchaeia archaeon]